MSAQTLQVLAVLVTYQLLLLGIGLMVRGLNRDREDFFLGGRRLGPAGGRTQLFRQCCICLDSTRI